MKVLITGSPDITSYEVVTNHCVNIVSELQYLFDVRTSDVEIVSVHENRGVMWLVEKWAKENKLRLRTFKADWNDITTQPVIIGTGSYGKYNKLAGANRNSLALGYMKSSVIACIAFDDARFKPTKDIIRLSKKQGIPTWQVNCKDTNNTRIKIWNNEGNEYGGI